MVKIAGLDSNNEFEAESVKDHIKNLAASAVDVSGLARREDVDSITQKIESGELKGEPGEVVGVFGETDATFDGGALTLDPNGAVIRVPYISGSVSVWIEDVDLPEGVESADGVQVALMMDGVAWDAVVTWPEETVIHDSPLPKKHVALLIRTGGHWEVYFPPLPSGGGVAVDVPAESIFSDEFPVLQEKIYDMASNLVIDGRIIPIQEQITGTVRYNNGWGPEELTFGKSDSERGRYRTIAGVVEELWYTAKEAKSKAEFSGNAILDASLRKYDEQEEFVFPDPTSPGAVGQQIKVTRPSTVIKTIDGVPYMTYWMPVWSENMSKFLAGEMTAQEFGNLYYTSNRPYRPLERYVPDPEDPQNFIIVQPPQEELDKYYQDKAVWAKVFQASPIKWEAYTTPVTREESLDITPEDDDRVL